MYFFIQNERIRKASINAGSTRIVFYNYEFKTMLFSSYIIDTLSLE